MPKDKNIGEVDEAEAEKAEKDTGAKALDVFDAKGQFVRTYDSETHGKQMKENAEGYAKKIGGTVKKHN